MADRELTPDRARQMFSPREPDEEPAESPEPAIEGLPPKDKPIADYTPEEWAAQRAALDRTISAKAKQEQREGREEEARRQAEANRTPDQQFGDALRASLQPGAKHARNEALVRSLLPGVTDD